ncbi:MAG TPA: alpha/beta fold hydrolase [Hyalangium sp.]|nr:alpha/beta fold hydrolase [Hyalangium sp.]
MRAHTEAEPVTIPTSGDWELAGSLWAGASMAERSLLCLPAIGTTQRYLRWLAEDLARRGWGVMTFDYRGVGASRGGRSVRNITADDWAGEDIPAALEVLRRQTGASFVGVLAHSLGGQLFGMSPASEQVDGALLLASQRGMPRLFTGRHRLRVEYAYRAFPLLIRLWGELPVTRLTFPEACPPGAVLQWIHWGREGVFRDARGEDVEARFGRFRGPLVSVRIEDDEADAPLAAVEALEQLFTAASLRREALRPRDFGADRIGHFGPFSPRAPSALRDRLDAWLRDLQGGLPASTAPR